MKVFNSFLAIFCGAILFMLPITSMVDDYQVDPRTDAFTVVTAVAQTTANVTLLEAINGNDTSTLAFTSNISEVPTMSSYNATNRQLLVQGLTDNETRSLSVTYDVDALNENASVDNIVNRIPLIYLLMIVAFPVVAILAIVLRRGN